MKEPGASTVTNLQLYIAIGIPIIAVLASLTVSLLQVSGIRAELTGIRADLRQQAADFREDLRHQAANFREDMQQMRADLRTMTGKIVEIDNRLTRLDERLEH
jgi:septal ring factor EnvC (AmiA/AmiB activator)